VNGESSGVEGEEEGDAFELEGELQSRHFFSRREECFFLNPSRSSRDMLMLRALSHMILFVRFR